MYREFPYNSRPGLSAVLSSPQEKTNLQRARATHQQQPAACSILHRNACSRNGASIGNISFQPDGPAFPGYLVDSGLAFGARGNGQTYGWNVSVDGEARNRNNSLSPDKRYDTLIHMGNAVWEIALPNGSYTVHVVVGSPNFTDVVSKLTVEGVLAINGTTSTSNRWLQATVTVSVNDGKLTVTNLAGSYNKICFIDISVP